MDCGLSVSPYVPKRKKDWDDFVRQAKNGSFLFFRDYMEYHSDRFEDFSLVISRNGKTVALLPASFTHGKISSHGGLTYGGFILRHNATVQEVLDIFQEVIKFLRGNGISLFEYKPLPRIYSTIPSDEDLYALFRNNARLTARNVSVTIKMDAPHHFRRIRQRGITRAEEAGLLFSETMDFAPFWSLLEENLKSKFGTKPVHTLSEITKLSRLFPENIRLFTASYGIRTIGGIVCYVWGKTVHTQYISASEEGKKLGAIDFITDRLVNSVFKNTEWFDFGTSNEKSGHILNETLISQKEGFGAHAICYDTYEIDINPS